ncbi:hypothetical protein ONZ45_g9456 [Pleurotus djamor]|nr:hypothetical protein ONZ45_g9456 [Pleurotus djamor]
MYRTLVGFSDPQYETEDLPREVEARARRRRKVDRTKSADTTSKSADATASTPRTLDLSTYKLHALGDYVEAIRNLGTTASWSTQIGELEHRYVKRLYPLTNKTKYTSQIAQHEQRERLLRALRHRMDGIHRPTEQADDEPDHSSQETLLPPEPSLSQHHFISSSHRQALSDSGFIDDHEDDIAFKNFLPKLEAHLLGRLLGIRYTGDEHEFSGQELSEVIIANDRLYAHKVLRVFYTSYDSRRCYDVLNPRRHADFITRRTTTTFQAIPSARKRCTSYGSGGMGVILIMPLDLEPSASSVWDLSKLGGAFLWCCVLSTSYPHLLMDWLKSQQSPCLPSNYPSRRHNGNGIILVCSLIVILVCANLAEVWATIIRQPRPTQLMSTLQDINNDPVNDSENESVLPELVQS